MRMLVLSGINLFEGGPLSIYFDCIDSILEQGINHKYLIVAFVHKKKLFNKYINSNITFIELPKSRKCYLYRLWYEYAYFYQYSQKKEIDIWISLHDITPNVRAKKIYTYCHNPTPFMKKNIFKAKYSITNVAFSYFYKYLYRINIKSATAIIVQQDWVRKEFYKMYPIKNVIVAKPKVDYPLKSDNIIYDKKNSKKIFIFASFPRYFKNFEVICKACQNLEYLHNFEVWFTLDGTENKYSQYLRKKYGNIDSIKWLGLKKRNEIFELYLKSDCMIFPSVLETWGLPISEYKLTCKDIIVSDLPYAHETVGEYDKVMFFDPYNPNELIDFMIQVINGTPKYMPQTEILINKPYANSWKELLNLIIEEK